MSDKVTMRWTRNRNAAGRFLDYLTEDVEIGGYTIPAGFESDGISVRTWHILLLTDYRQARWAALLHDYLLYMCGWHVVRRRNGVVVNVKMTRSIANREFYEQMKRDGVGRWTRTMMYAAVCVYSFVRSLNSFVRSLKWR